MSIQSQSTPPLVVAVCRRTRGGAPIWGVWSHRDYQWAYAGFARKRDAQEWLETALATGEWSREAEAR